MMRYLFNMMVLGVFLVLGINHIPHKEMQMFLTGTEKAIIQSYAEPDYCESTAVIQQLQKYKRDIKDKNCRCQNNESILENISLYRTNSCSKTSKPNSPVVPFFIFSFSKFQSPDIKQKIISSDTNFTRYSYRYYVYTLERMLI